MQVFRIPADVNAEYLKSVIAIGNFDALHVGHQQIICSCVEAARYRNVKCGLVTFEPHPSEILRNIPYDHINSFDERLAVLQQMGLDFIYVFNFDDAFSTISAKTFIHKHICKVFKPSAVFTGYNFKFGYNRQGDNKLLAHLALTQGFKYQAVDEVMFGGLQVSTSVIKKQLQLGSVIQASNMLGRNINYCGKVIHGKGIAKNILGFATANIDADFDGRIKPLFGVYLASVIIQGQTHYGIMNLGVKPTVTSENKCSIEVHLFDFNQNIYGENAYISPLALIRPERKFKDLEALKLQISLDVKLAKYSLKNLALHHLEVELSGLTDLKIQM